MNRITAYVAGLVTAFAVAAGGLGVAAIAAADPRPETNPNAIAEQFAVEIHWFTEGEAIPCGDGLDFYGCADMDTLDVIYVRSGLSDEVMQSVILHEIGHVIQGRLNLPADECGADAFARSLGATWFDYDC